LLDRVTQLEDAVRQLRGRIDESDNARQRQVDDLNKRIGDLEFRLNGAGGAGVGPALPPPVNPPTGKLSPPPGPLAAPPPGAAPPPVRRTPETALQDGNAALARRDYAAAEASAREVLASGRGPRTTDAQYLLAEALAGKRDYQGAAVAFDDTYTRNPKGSKAPESLLGLANSLTAINEKKAACQTLDKLRAEFPTLRGDLRSLAAAARQRASCG
jgi:TolA-binding protein